ncbi:MAG: chlorite dismutase family protein [Fimbriimonadaceae bacterium]|nr:chlorite dismutase family protein [Fimbriimonadaceae bacterium]
MSASPAAPPRQYVHFNFYRVDPAWRRLPVAARSAGKEAFAGVVAAWQQRQMIVIPYSLTGLRGDCDLMLWRITTQLEDLQTMGAELLATPLGQYLSVPYAYLSQAKRSTYVDKLDPEHNESRSRVQPGRYRYNFVYPFVKTREWYLLHKQTRQGIMDEHIEVGTRFPTVKLNTTYSFGLDDQEFMLAFETDHPGDFLDLVMALRETDGSRYTVRDTPIFTCLRQDLAAALDALGG